LPFRRKAAGHLGAVLSRAPARRRGSRTRHTDQARTEHGALPPRSACEVATGLCRPVGRGDQGRHPPDESEHASVEGRSRFGPAAGRIAFSVRHRVPRVAQEHPIELSRVGARPLARVHSSTAPTRKACRARRLRSARRSLRGSTPASMPPLVKIPRQDEPRHYRQIEPLCPTTPDGRGAGNRPAAGRRRPGPPVPGARAAPTHCSGSASQRSTDELRSLAT